ncbi:MAG TPA: hypothetical protein VHZ73_03635 [Vicinamibacterales bacterium]|jgi:hypothetical protein|nr:hypothetical protein [Vicinamibacterales bacterium]
MTNLRRLVVTSLCAVLAAAALTVAACGKSDTSPTASTSVTLLDTSVTLLSGVTCNTGNMAVDFSGTAGKTVVITATGSSSLVPHFTLYAPDFAVQLGGSTSGAAGAASLTFTLTQTGVHHVSLCDSNGTAGTLHVTVVQQ